MESPLRVAACQMETTHDVADNARDIHEAIDNASHKGVSLLVVPECALCGYLPRPDTDFGALARHQAELAGHAAQSDMWLALGTVRNGDDGWLNSALLFSPDGELYASYDKTHLMPGERGVFVPGNGLPIFRAGDWTFGIQICFDMRFPENWRILRRKGAELVLHLSSASRAAAWKVPVLEGAVRSRAAENGMFVVSANDAGVPQMMVSAICDPDGRDLARASENREEMLFAILDRAAAKSNYLDARRTDIWSRPEHRDLLLQ